MQESQTAQSNTGLIYGLNDRPPVREAIFAAIQHLLAIFVAIITPPLIIAGALKLDLEEQLGVSVDVLHAPLPHDAMIIPSKVVPLYE